MPIFWGNLFQQLYNIVDSLIVGNFLGKEALGAVTATGSLIFLLVGFFGGTFSGAGVVIARYFGANDKEKVERAIHTSVFFGLIAGGILTVLGTIFAPHILVLMGTPESVLPDALTYIRIYFMGILTIVLYNTANGIFQAVGDSKRPLLFLLISSVINVVLDLLFVVQFEMGIAGAAIATVLAQMTSVILAFTVLMRTKDIYRISIKKISYQKDMLIQILKYGIPSGIQNSVIALANMVVQTNINKFDANAVAGCGSYSKIEGFVFIPITSFSMALTTFIGQNLGAGKVERAKKGSRFGIIASMILAETVGIIFYTFAPLLISMFSQDPQVIAIGTAQAKTITLFYFMLAFAHSVAGVMRGAGKANVPMLIMLSCWCIIRVIYVTTMTHFIPKIDAIFWAYPLTWFLSCILFAIFYFRSTWLKGFRS